MTWSVVGETLPLSATRCGPPAGAAIAPVAADMPVNAVIARAMTATAPARTGRLVKPINPPQLLLATCAAFTQDPVRIVTWRGGDINNRAGFRRFSACGPRP